MYSPIPPWHDPTASGLACWCRRIHTPRGPGRMMNGRYLLGTRRNMGSIGIPAGLGYLFLNMTTWINWTRPSEILAATRFLDVLSIRHAILLEWVCCQWWPKTWAIYQEWTMVTLLVEPSSLSVVLRFPWAPPIQKGDCCCFFPHGLWLINFPTMNNMIFQ